MGGKSKQARVKNNAKPSNSSRSAELLGSSVPAFVGFSAFSDHGLIPVAPGFSDNVLDTFEPTTDPQLQLILRKMSKKDPVTKVKALQEFSELINVYDLESVKGVLPLWPKLYHNLANDPDHRVRESSQEVMNIIASKCKKAIAPFLKQLVPVWLGSNFDNYAPAASIANNSLTKTFASNANKVREALLYCQNEIVDHTVRNLTFHTASTLSMPKNCTPEEAEQKFQRTVCCSLKTLSFFLEKTNGSDISNVQQNLQNMLTNSKFWSLAKFKDIRVKAAWFELLYTILQNTSLKDTMCAFKTQTISSCFQNIDESEPIIATHVWGCILLIQSTYDDWHVIANFKKVIVPKLSTFLRNGCNKNANAICPNLLPFLSKVSQECLNEIQLKDFQKQFFDHLKTALTTLENSSKSDISSITTAYFECLRYVVQKINSSIRIDSADGEVEAFRNMARQLLTENIIGLLTWCLTSEALAVKYIILHTSSLIAFWADPAKDSKLYSELLELFWKNTISLITDSLTNNKDNEIFLDHIIEFIDKLYSANPRIEDQKVKFALEAEVYTEECEGWLENSKVKIALNVDECKKITSSATQLNNSTDTNFASLEERPTSTSYIHSELKKLVIQLVRLCLGKCTQDLSSKYIIKVRKLSTLFCDVDFYERISEEKTLMGTLNMLIKLMNNCDSVACDDTIDIIFEILYLLQNNERYNFIQLHLLKIQKPSIQNSIMDRLLSYPHNVEPEVRSMMTQSEASSILINVAKDVLNENSKDCLNLLRKCFFQTDSEEIPINSTTVEEILKIVSEPLSPGKGMEHSIDLCGSFIAQMMPVICSGGNSSPACQRDIFLKLFKFSIENMPHDFLSEDTLWEISTSWQDALSSQDILIDQELLQDCKKIVQNCLQNESISIEAIEVIADAITQVIICSTEHIEDENEYLLEIDLTIKEFFDQDLNNSMLKNIRYANDFCLFMEAVQGKISIGKELHNSCMEDMEMTHTFRQILLHSYTIYKLVCKPSIMRRNYNGENASIEDYCKANENLHKQWSNILYDETLRCINLASIGDAVINIDSQIKKNFATIAMQLSEKVKMLLRECSEDFICNLKERMLDIASNENDTTACRALLYLVNTNQYAQFEENATILLLEELSEFFATRNSLKAYVNTLQYLLPNLLPKSISTQMPIMKMNPGSIWIKAAIFCSLVQNNFNSDFNEKSDHSIIAQTLQFLSEVAEQQHSNKELLLYNTEIHKQPFERVVDTMEFINILIEVIKNFPYELTIKHWDLIRIGLSSWVLSVSKSIEQLKNPQVSLFISNVYKLYAELVSFIRNEKPKSSTEFLKNIIDEWEHLFAREVNLVLFKSYYNLVGSQELAHSISTSYNVILEKITPAIELLDYEIVFNFYKTSTKVTIDNVINFLLKNLSNSTHCVRTNCVYILKKLTQQCVYSDIGTYEIKSENIPTNEVSGDWHLLSRFEDYIGRYEIPIRKYLEEFNFKLTEIADLKPIDRNEGLSYLILWDCIIFICSNSPITLRSLYTSWLHEKRYEEKLLHFLFRAMPTEILKNHDSKIMATDVFKGLTWKQIKDQNVALERYACHLYTEVLRKLPAVVRKWWNTCQSRQKTFVDKLTTNFLSAIICSEELKAIGNKKEKHENMQVTVHTSTREVLAVYSIDEARMELVITLAQNYPLGSVKVESGKQIGGRLSSRNIGMQLTIFLTHQNGSIFDGLTLWKNNLDKKFEGVEECYVCYTVIHQDTCQLPKLTCKTCRKKFHGPCLYKWFTTSSKSTCPICRNVF